MERLHFLVYSDVEECAEAIAREIESLGHAALSQVLTDRGSLEKALREEDPAALVFDLGRAPHLTLDLIESLGAVDRPLMAIGPTDDSQLILRALQIGMREYVRADALATELEPALGRLAARGTPVATPAECDQAPLVAVMGAKGGVGATFVACQLAAVLQKSGRPTVLVDLNFPIGDVALHFDLRPAYTLANLAAEQGQFDVNYLRTILQRHPSGLRVLAAPARMEDAELVSGAHVERALDLIRGDSSWVVVDVSRSWNEPTIRALEMASEILLVTSLDLAAVSHTRQHLDLLERLGHDASRVRLVTNRHSSKESLSDDDFASFVGQRPEVVLPNDYPTAADAINGGRVLGDVAPRSALHGAFVELGEATHHWCGLEPPRRTNGSTVGARIRRMLRR